VDNASTGLITINPNKQAEIKVGLIGSTLNVLGTKYIRLYQELAMYSRLKSPLLFAQDVIHGYKTTFAIPLAEAASWDLEFLKLNAIQFSLLFNKYKMYIENIRFHCTFVLETSIHKTFVI